MKTKLFTKNQTIMINGWPGQSSRSDNIFQQNNNLSLDKDNNILKLKTRQYKLAFSNFQRKLCQESNSSNKYLEKFLDLNLSQQNSFRKIFISKAATFNYQVQQST